MTTIPKISIIVPIYNVEKFLHRCIDSLINQTLKEIEIILVDDGSPDGSPQICDNYALQDSRIKVIHKKNEGLGLTRNAGINIATGEFIAFVDSDDWVDSKMYETLYNTAKQYKCDTVFCSFQYYTINKQFIPKKEVESITFFQTQQEIKGFMLDMVAPSPQYISDVKYTMSTCKAIYLRNTINNKNIRFLSERKVLSEDLFFNLSYLSYAQKICFLPEYFYNYTYNPQSLSHTYTTSKYVKYKAFFIELRSLLNTLFKQEDYNIHFWRLQLLYLRHNVNAIFNSNTNKRDCKKIILEVLNDDLWQEALKLYPMNQLPLKHFIFYWTLKKKLFCFISILAYLSNKLYK